MAHGMWKPCFDARAAVVAVAAVLLVAAGADNVRVARARYQRGVLIRFEGPITPMLQQYLYRRLDAAKAERADLVVLEIDSPGGGVVESLEIAQRMRDLKWARTVAYVPREAISGAAIVALGCDEIVMDPKALLGDAGPIFMDRDFVFAHAPEKIRSYLAGQVRGLARAKDRPPALAEAMVDMNLAVFCAENMRTGEVTYLSEGEIAEHPDQWKKKNQVYGTGGGHFFVVRGSDAMKYHLAEATVATRSDLAARYQLEDDLLVLQPNVLDTVVSLLNWWPVAALLLIVGLVGLYIEFLSPGIALGGVISALCFSVFFWSRFLGGTAGWLAIVLFLLGLACLAVELFVLPGFGLAGITGLVLVLVSLVMASQRFLIPRTTQELVTLSHTMMVIFLACAVFLLVAVVLTRRFGSLPLLNRLTLAPPESGGQVQRGGEVLATSGSTGASSRLVVQVGDSGVAQTPLRPGGKGRFKNQYLDVLTQGDFVDPGARIRVVRVSGKQVVVEEEG